MIIESLKLRQGDSWDFSEDLGSYEPASWDMAIVLKQGSNDAIVINTVTDGGNGLFNVSVRSDVTSAIAPGKYSCAYVLSSGVKKNTVWSGMVVVYPDLAVASDSRSYWETTAAALRDAYLRMAGRESAEVTLNGNTVKYDRVELLKALNHAEYMVHTESSSNQSGRILARFV